MRKSANEMQDFAQIARCQHCLHGKNRIDFALILT